MEKDYKDYTINDYRKDINKIIIQNRTVKDQKDRTAIINKYNGSDGLLVHLNKRANDTDKGGLMEQNLYLLLLKRFYDWILSGKSDVPKDYYVNYRKPEAAAEISESMDTNSKVYTGGKNHYTSKPLKPRKSELKSDPYIRQAQKNLDAARNLKGNRFKKSRAIHDAKATLDDVITSHRGIDEFNRVDNTVTPQRSNITPNFDSPDYIKFLLKTDINEIINEDVREDKMDVDRAVGHKDQILKDLEKGFKEEETAARNHCSVSSVSRHLNTTTKHLLQSFR